jgi:GntR family transcriptional regulator
MGEAGGGLILARAAVLVQYDAMTSDDRPVYLKLRDIIAEAILDGRYRDGDPLPSVRAFAAEQGANPLTVAKAYQSFQDERLVTVRRGVGMFVAEGARARLRTAERDTFLRETWPRVRATIERLDLRLDELLAHEPG